MEVTLDVRIDAPPVLVFAVLADVPRWPARIEAITRVETLTSGPVAPGTRFRETRLMFGRTATEEMTVAELVTPVLLVLTADNHGTHYRMTHRLSPEGAATRLNLVFEGQPQTFLARLLAPLGYLMANSVRRQIEADLASLKRSIETLT